MLYTVSVLPSWKLSGVRIVANEARGQIDGSPTLAAGVAKHPLQPTGWYHNGARGQRAGGLRALLANVTTPINFQLGKESHKKAD